MRVSVLTLLVRTKLLGGGGGQGAVGGGREGMEQHGGIPRAEGGILGEGGWVCGM